MTAVTDDGREEGERLESARSRILELVDPGTFVEFGKHRGTLPETRGSGDMSVVGESAITGCGTIYGRQVAVYSLGGEASAGVVGEAAGDKLVRVLRFALRTGSPVIGIIDSCEARPEGGVSALGALTGVLRELAGCSGEVPCISVVVGEATGVASCLAALADVVVAVDGATRMFMSGPEAVMSVTGHRPTVEELGGAAALGRAGCAHYLADDEDDALDYVRVLLGYLPEHRSGGLPVYDSDAPAERTGVDDLLDQVAPSSVDEPYDMRVVVESVLDDGDFLELQELFAGNILVGFGRIDGHSVGVVANQPADRAGVLDAEACDKATRFVRFCSSFSIPVVTLVDTPGFLPGTDQESRGVPRRGADLLRAYAEASVPLVTVITRRASGSAYTVMGSKRLGVDLVAAWSTAELGPYAAAALGEIDEVIEPADTRLVVGGMLRRLRATRAVRQ